MSSIVSETVHDHRLVKEIEANCSKQKGRRLRMLVCRDWSVVDEWRPLLLRN